MVTAQKFFRDNERSASTTRRGGCRNARTVRVQLCYASTGGGWRDARLIPLKCCQTLTVLAVRQPSRPLPVHSCHLAVPQSRGALQHQHAACSAEEKQHCKSKLGAGCLWLQAVLSCCVNTQAARRKLSLDTDGPSHQPLLSDSLVNKDTGSRAKALPGLQDQAHWKCRGPASCYYKLLQATACRHTRLNSHEPGQSTCQ